MATQVCVTGPARETTGAICSRALPAPSWASPWWRGGSRASLDQKGVDGLPAALRHQRRRAPGHSPGLAPSLSETSPEGPEAHPRQQEGGVHKAQATWCPHLFAQLRAKRLPLGEVGTVLPGPGLGAEECWAVAGQAAQDG